MVARNRRIEKEWNQFHTVTLVTKGKPVIPGVGERDDREAELTEEKRVFEHGSLAHVVEGLFLFEALRPV
jgi:hypothetical protein